MGEHQSFSDALSELEGAREDMNGMLHPAPGWEWAQKPRRGRSTCVATGSIVTNTLRIAGVPGPDGALGAAGLAVTIAQGGANAMRCRQCRPVAYDRDGRRYLFEGGSSGSMSSGESGADDFWVRGGAHLLHAHVLREEDIAFLGIEIEAKTEEKTEEKTE
jgi:hypothetical protein